MISSVWPMPKNSKVSKNEQIVSQENIESHQHPSLFDDFDNQIDIISKLAKQFLSNTTITNKEIVAFKNSIKQIVHNIDNKNLKIATTNINEDGIGFLVYDPKGQIPFPKSLTNFDIDDPF